MDDNSKLTKAVVKMKLLANDLLEQDEYKAQSEEMR
jgi:hypothetical protein